MGEFVGFSAPNYLAPDQTVDSADGQGTLATQSRNWVWNGTAWVRETQPGGSGSDVTATGTLGALNASVSVPLAGLGGAGVELEAGTLIGTVIAEASYDGGTTWATINFVDPASLATTQTVVFASSNPQTTKSFQALGGMSHVRIRVSAYTSGSCTANVRATITLTNVPGSGSGGGTVNQGNPAALSNAWPFEVTDGTHGPAAVKAASTAAVATDPSLVVALSPNSPLPTGANVIGAVTQSGTWTVQQGTPPWSVNQSGTWTVQQGTPPWSVNQSGAWTVTQGPAAAIGGAWPTEVTDGTHGPAAVKAASTAAVAADPSLVVALSPNSPLPAGSNALGSVTVTGTVTPAVLPDLTAGPTALNALNAAQSIAVAGYSGAGFILAAGTLVGTIIAEASYDGGTTWSTSDFWSPAGVSSTIVFGSANPATQQSIIIPNGASHVRVRVSVYSSGTANVTLRATTNGEIVTQGPGTGAYATSDLWSVGIGFGGAQIDPRSIRALTSADVVTADQGGAPWSVSQSGAWTVAQGTAAALAGAWPTELTDGTHGPAAVKAASTAAVAADPSLVVALSPNSPLPTGANVIGAVTQSGTWTVAQGTAAALAGAWPTEITDGTHGPAAVKAASTAAAAADPSLVVALSPNSVGRAELIDVNVSTSTIALNALNASAPVSTNVFGSGIGVVFPSGGTLIGTVVPELSFDFGATYVAGSFYDPVTGLISSSLALTSGNAEIVKIIPYLPGCTHVQVSVSAYTSGTITPSLVSAQQGAMVTAIQGPPTSTLANAWPFEVTDGTHGPAAVKAASTAAVAADPSLVVALSPNSPLPTGANVIGAVTQSGTWTVQQGTPPWSVQGDAASGVAVAGNPLLQGGRAATALPTAVSDGQAVAAQMDSLGRTVTTRIPTALQLQNGNTTLTTTSSTQLIAAQAAGVRIAVTHIHVSNTSATGVRVDILDGSTVIWSDFVAPSGGGAGEDFGIALLGSAATALNAQLSAAVTDVRVSVVAHQIK